MKPIPIHPEGPRYARSLVFVPGLWGTAAGLLPLATFLGHRGWQGTIVDAEGAGGVEQRARDVAACVGGMAPAPILVGHDAGGLVALEAATRTAVSGVAWLAPVGNRRGELLRRLGVWRVVGAMLSGRDVPRPDTALRSVLFGDVSPTALRQVDAVQFVRDTLRRAPARPAADVPFLTVSAATHADAGPPGAVGEHAVVEVTGPSLLAPNAWRPAAGALHRWLVRRLGAENLELYEEAMAERDDPDA